MKMKFRNVSSFSETEIEEIKDAIHWAANLLSLNEVENYLLKFTITDKVLQDNKAVMGSFLPAWNDVGEITIRKQKKLKHSISTVFHEMAHCQQVVQGRMVPKAGLTYWHNKPYVIERGMSFFKYWKLPWEVEARKLERILYNEWWKETKPMGKLWKRIFG